MRKIAARAVGSLPDDVEVYRQIFQGKWRLPILREIAGGPRRLDIHGRLEVCMAHQLLNHLDILSVPFRRVE